jgi:hypothetical protein
LLGFPIWKRWHYSLLGWIYVVIDCL